MTDETLEEMWDNILPDWAAAKIRDGDYLVPFAILPTRDGRNTGNAVLLEQIKDRQLTIKGEVLNVYLVVTDVGNFIRLTPPEIEELFYPPKWVAKPDFFSERTLKLQEAYQQWKNSSQTQQD